MVSRIPPASPAATMLREQVVERVRAAWPSRRPATRRPRRRRVVASMAARQLLVRLFLGEQFETLHQRQAGVDHDRELPREDREVCAPTRALTSSLLLRGGLDLADEDLLSAQLLGQRLGRFRRPFTVDGLVRCVCVQPRRMSSSGHSLHRHPARCAASVRRIGRRHAALRES